MVSSDPHCCRQEGVRFEEALHTYGKRLKSDGETTRRIYVPQTTLPIVDAVGETSRISQWAHQGVPHGIKGVTGHQVFGEKTCRNILDAY